MKRITVWIDCSEAEVVEVTREVEALLRKMGVVFTVHPTTDDIFSQERSK